MEVQRQGGLAAIASGVAFNVIALIVLLGAVTFAAPFDHAAAPRVYLAIACYFVLGVLLGRLVFRRLVRWNRVTSNLAQKSTAKLFHVVLWPYTYPVLLFRALIDLVF